MDDTVLLRLVHSCLRCCRTVYGCQSVYPILPHTLTHSVLPVVRAEQQCTIPLQRASPANTAYTRMGSTTELLSYQSLPSARDQGCGHGRLVFRDHARACQRRRLAFDRRRWCPVLRSPFGLGMILHTTYQPVQYDTLSTARAILKAAS